MINIGIIGTGFGAKIHVPGFRALRGVRVLGIVGSDFKKTERIAKDLNIPHDFASWKELIDHPDINAVSIASPPYLHKEMAISAARAGKHILCEKPFALNKAQGKSMLEEVRKAGVVNMIDFEFRNIPGLKKLHSILNKKTLGNIRHVNISWLTGGRASKDVPLSWQNDLKKGGGTLFAYAPHVIDYTEMLFGRIRSVSAILSIAKKNRASAEDTCDILCMLDRDIVVNISISNVLANARGNVIEVYGDNGSAVLENNNLYDGIYGFKLFMHLVKDKQKTQIPISVPKDINKYKDYRLPIFIETANTFVLAIKNNRSGNPSFAEGLRNQKVLDAAKKSNRLKKEITI